MDQAVKELISHIRDAHNALCEDLEAKRLTKEGGGGGCAIKTIRFSKEFPALFGWMHDLSVLADQVEHQMALNGQERAKESKLGLEPLRQSALGLASAAHLVELGCL